MTYAYAVLMEDEAIDPEAAIHEELTEGDGESEADVVESDTGYAQTVMSFEQRLYTATSLENTLQTMSGNSDMLVGALRAMSAYGVGNSVSLIGLESASDSGLSFLTGMESVEAEKKAASSGIWSTITGWFSKKWQWVKTKCISAYEKCAGWLARMKAARAERIDAAAKYATTKADLKAADASFKAAEDAHKALEQAGKASKPELNAAVRNMYDAKNAKIVAAAKFDRADAVYKKGWNYRGIVDRLSKLVDALKPSNLANTWSNIKNWFSSKYSSIKSSLTKSSAAATAATDTAAEAGGTASGAMKTLSKLSLKWWAGIAIAVAAVVGVCIALWRKYKKDDPEGAAAADQAGEAAEAKTQQMGNMMMDK